MNDPETVLPTDKWAGQSTLDAHHKAPMMKKIAILRDKYHLRMRVKKFAE